MGKFCFALCSVLPRCKTCCGLPIRVGALLVGIITVVFKVISVGTDICLIEQTYLPPLNTSESTIIIELEYLYLYVALGIDVFILLFAGILQCGVITSNSTKVQAFNIFFFFDWTRLLGIVIYEVVLYVEDKQHPISTSICEDLSAFYTRVCLVLNFFFLFIVNSYHHKLVKRARIRRPQSRTLPSQAPAPTTAPMPVYIQPPPQRTPIIQPTPGPVYQFVQVPQYPATQQRYYRQYDVPIVPYNVPPVDYSQRRQADVPIVTHNAPPAYYTQRRQPDVYNVPPVDYSQRRTPSPRVDHRSRTSNRSHNMPRADYTRSRTPSPRVDRLTSRQSAESHYSRPSTPSSNPSSQSL